MQLVADDPVNRRIWTESVALQRQIVKQAKQPLLVGAQQAMPKTCDEAKFSPESPLPWVPDLVGARFGIDRQSVLVVASSYNGFIEGYSKREAVMPLREYVNAKNDDHDGLERFCRSYVDCVVNRDEDYYQPILHDLLPPAGCDLDCCCLTDLCKASFVRRGSKLKTKNRGDKGSDAIIRYNWRRWIPYVAGWPDARDQAPLPYQWLWQRMQQCHVIVALGTIAEYGVLKVFQRLATAPRAWSWGDSTVVPDHRTMTANVPDWEYCYANSRRKLKDWLASEDWWVLGGSSGKRRWFMLPVHHPASAIGRGKDTRYLNTVPRLQRMMEEATSTL